MLILGVDPGLRTTGFGVIESDRQNIRYIESGCIRSGDGDLSHRLGVIFSELSTVVAQHQLHWVAIEKVFVNKNPQSTLLLGQARGAAICAVVAGGVPVAEYTALQVKKAVVGYGHAQKQQVQEMVKRLLNLTKVPTTDASDALACAICHASFLRAFGSADRKDNKIK